MATTKKGAGTFPVTPLHDNVFIKRAERDAYRGSIILPDQSKEKPFQGTVLAVGPGKLTEEGSRLPMSVEPGQQVLFGQFSAMALTVEDEDYLVLKDGDIRGVLNS
jgi:chaperonin GroES